MVVCGCFGCISLAFFFQWLIDITDCVCLYRKLEVAHDDELVQYFMKKIFAVMVMFLSLTTGYSQSTVTCGACNGYGVLRCSACNGGGVVCAQVWNPYYGCFQTVQQYCGYCGGRGTVVCSRCGGYGCLVVNSHPSFKGGRRVLCDNSRVCPNNSSKTYKGYDNGNNGYIVDTDKCLNCGHRYGVHKKK